jgi:hypothetical protein
MVLLATSIENERFFHLSAVNGLIKSYEELVLELKLMMRLDTSFKLKKG